MDTKYQNLAKSNQNHPKTQSIQSWELPLKQHLENMIILQVSKGFILTPICPKSSRKTNSSHQYQSFAFIKMFLTWLLDKSRLIIKSMQTQYTRIFQAEVSIVIDLEKMWLSEEKVLTHRSISSGARQKHWIGLKKIWTLALKFLSNQTWL